MHLRIPLQIKKSTNINDNIDDDFMTVNNFFTHFIKEIDIRRYGDDIRILPTNNTVDIYRYSDAMLKHMPEDTLKTYDETLLYSKKAVKLANNVDRYHNNTGNSRTDDNLDDQIDKFHDLLGKKDIQNTFKIFVPFRSSKFSNTFRHKIYFYVRARFKQVVWIEKEVNAIPEPDAKIIVFEMPFISYPKIILNENFEVYFNSVLRSKKL